LKKLIITGHGLYASGLRSSLELLAGPNEDVHFLDFPAEMTEQGLKQRMEEVIQSFPEEELLFICDILGGTPYKNAAILANVTDRIEVVAGCNIGSILEVIFQKDHMPLVDLADLVVDSSKKYTVRFEKLQGAKPVYTEEASFEDGI